MNDRLQAKVRYAVRLMSFFRKRSSEKVGVLMNSYGGLFIRGYLYSLQIIGTDIVRGFSVAILIAVHELVGVSEQMNYHGKGD